MGPNLSLLVQLISYIKQLQPREIRQPMEVANLIPATFRRMYDVLAFHASTAAAVYVVWWEIHSKPPMACLGY